MILIIAALLGLVGTAALGLAAHGLWISRPFRAGPCDMPSPDNDDCTGTG